MSSIEHPPQDPTREQLLATQNERLSSILDYARFMSESLGELPSVERLSSTTILKLADGYKISVTRLDGSSITTTSNRSANDGLMEYAPGQPFLADSLGVSFRFTRMSFIPKLTEKVEYCFSESTTGHNDTLQLVGSLQSYALEVVAPDILD